jgi:hypothetical protein
MADLLPIIEAMEHRFMRAWVGRDARTLKALTSRHLIFLMGSKPPVILDSRSWLDAATTRYRCTGYRFGDVYVRELGTFALFASQLDLDASMDGNDWSGRLWVTDLWRRGRVRRGWRLVERIVSRIEDKAEAPAAIKSLQLWR